MRAAIYIEKTDPPRLVVREVDTPEPGPDEVVVKILYTGVNPIDYWIASGRYPLDPPNRIVGSEASGIVVDVGENVTRLKKGMQVSIYPWIHCGDCEECREGHENLCLRGGIVGGVVDGTYAEYVKLPEENVYEAGGEPEIQATAGVSALTAKHAVNRALELCIEKALVYGASGNVGMYIVQYLANAGIDVAAVTRKDWVSELGASRIVPPKDVGKLIDEWGEPDLIINPLGGQVLAESLGLVRRHGYVMIFGGLTSMDIPGGVAPIYRREASLIGVTGGTIQEFKEVVRDLERDVVKPRIWRVYSLDEAGEALNNLFSGERDGKILIKATD